MTNLRTPEDRAPFLDHLEELRRRIIVCIAAVLVGTVISFGFKEKIFRILVRPLVEALPQSSGHTLIYTAPHEAFVTYLKVAVLAGVGLASPVIIFEFWRFVAPGLYEHEKRYLFPIVAASVIFFLGGSLFGYFVVFPFGFKFFTSFATDFITPMISTKEFLSFAVRLLLVFGLVFELPLIVFFLARLGLITDRFLKRQRKYAILVIFIVAAVLTPPDVFTQLLMAGPLLVLYEISVWIAYFFGRRGNAENGEKEEVNSNE
ncbi:twin-arginine translocase subunit TatC [Thermodesulforhabdus norvegica]|uniref:Sec-independent protein translocase protein TatC n=1 Tax=Thermodesulforhabdus norvegica TaxID=39841 RepID=A0A1I4SA42_9BACT|nr:twin-arginine translocase subunit TatC [Thermodesulforhabdus norvegica]SFM61349.1 Sec-independent protein translocase TatC [Thermodesulforhabdus norvegica]